jgi:hypothetical protein
MSGALEVARRAGKREAAPFSKGVPARTIDSAGRWQDAHPALNREIRSIALPS